MCQEGGSAVEKIRFTKMHGIGNDYLYVFGDVPENIKDICIRI